LRHEDELMIDIDGEDVVEASRVLGIAVYYSRKSYNPQFLFSDMISAWGIERLAGVEKLGDYIFKVEFTREEEKVRVIEGGPWRHKGDALLIAHYASLLRPSEIPIQSIGLWVRLYDLPTAMMKPTIAQKPGEQLGKFLKTNTRFLGYLCIRIRYLLGKPLMPSLAVTVKGRGQMLITLRYENVPHFCFSCGRIGHAAVNYDAMVEAQGVAYGEELSASPLRHTKEIMVKLMGSRVARSLFQVGNMPTRGQLLAGHGNVGGASGGTKVRVQAKGMAEEGKSPGGIGVPFVNLVNELHDACNSAEAIWAAQGSTGKERVSFRTNMTIEEESSDGGSVEQKPVGAMTTIEQFHARKLKGKDETGTGRHAVLKITGVESSKKQRTPIKMHLKEALNELVGEEVSRRTKRLADVSDMDQQLMDIAMHANPQIVDHEHLMGTRDKSHQEQ
jgi:hypothetical protein